MHQLSGLDASFLAMDTDSNFGHIGSVTILETEEPFTLERLVDVTRERLHLVPAYTQKLLEVPFGIDMPYWVDDENFDLEYHLREIALPAPGNDQQLAEQAARLHSRPLDRSRPLWETYLIHGLEGGRQALYSKIHHAAIDGASGAEMLGLLLDPSPEGREIPPAVPRTPEAVPTELELFTRGLVHRALQPVRDARITEALTAAWPEITRAYSAQTDSRDLVLGKSSNDRAGLTSGSNRPPSTPFNRNVTPHRRWSFRRVLLDDLKQIRADHDVTVNDVVVAMCAGALRRWLIDRQALPEAPLVAAVPISLRTADKAGTFGNQVSNLIAPIPTHLDDPLARLQATHEAMRAAKERHAAIPASVLTDITQSNMPALMAQAARVSAELRLAEKNIPFNVTISNVPGPRVPLYVAGAKLLGIYPLSAIADGMGLNITVNGYNDGLGFGLIACRELVPDVDRLAGYLIEELDALKAIG